MLILHVQRVNKQKKKAYFYHDVAVDVFGRISADINFMSTNIHSQRIQSVSVLKNFISLDGYICAYGDRCSWSVVDTKSRGE